MYKVLFLPRWYPAENDRQNGVFIQKHAQAAALKHHVVVLYAQPSEKEPVIEETKKGNLTEIIIYYKTSFVKPLNVFLYAMAIFKGWKKIKKTGFFPDIAHVHVLNRPALLALWLKFRHNVPFIISEHWSGYVTGGFEQRGLLSGLFTFYAIKRAAMVTVVSETLKAGMLKCGLKADYRILPNVVEVLPETWKQQPPTDAFRFLVVADLRDDIKNISGVMRAFATIYKENPETVLTIAGNGPDASKLLALSLQLGVPINFLGGVLNDVVLRLISNAHVIIINSRIETFSVVTLEAIFSGRPVISTRCGGPEQFINEQNGILIEKDNEEQLAAAMNKIKVNYSSYPAEKVRVSIPNVYSMEDILLRMSNYYNEVVGH